MPIYEFYCAACHRLFSFFARRVDTAAAPNCPRCGAKRLPRRPSTFAVSRGLGEPSGETGTGDQARFERALEGLAGEAERLGENDTRGAAQLMRRLFADAGMPLGAGMAEALARMEAGEDPDRIDADLGEALEDDAAEGGDAGDAPAARLRRIARRALPPSVDPTLYEL